MITPHSAMEAVALTFGIAPSVLLENDRKRTASDSRKALAVILRDHLGLSWGAIAGIMGRTRDTVMNSYQKGRDLLDTDRPFQKSMAGVMARITTTTAAAA
jgi:chromosomal replication initiation ATPase DnaA